MNRLKYYIRYIKETILYYIIYIYSESWFYYNVIKMVDRFKHELNDYCNTKNDAIWLIDRKRFKYIPKSYKYKLINEKFN